MTRMIMRDIILSLYVCVQKMKMVSFLELHQEFIQTVCTQWTFSPQMRCLKKQGFYLTTSWRCYNLDYI